MEQQLSVDELAVGMFVCALDRPWLDTPFLVQGFLIEDEETLAQLRQTCRQVTIDLSRSANDDPDCAGIHPTAPVAIEAKVGRVVSLPAPAHQQRPPRSLLPRWLQALFASRGPIEPELFVKPSAALLLEKEAQRSPVKHVNRPVARKFEPRAPSVSASERKPDGVAIVLRGDLLAWLREQLERVRSSAPEGRNAAADAPEPAKASRLKRSASGPTIYQDNVPLEQELQCADESFGAAIDMLGTVMHDIRVGKGLEIEAVESVVEDLVESIIRHPGALQLVSRMREADESSYTHALQVAVLLASFGRELGFSRKELTYLGQVGMLLDVGKLRIDQRILNKRGNLTAERVRGSQASTFNTAWKSSSPPRSHTRTWSRGWRTTTKGSMEPAIRRACRMRKFPPSGKWLASWTRSLLLRRSARTQSPCHRTAAMQQLQGWADTYFNAGLVELFIQAIGIFPVGTLVELSTGELAVVLEQSRPRRLKPKVLVVSAPDKTPLEIPFVLDLLHGEGASADRVPYIRQGLPTASFAVDPTEYYLSRS